MKLDFEELRIGIAEKEREIRFCIVSTVRIQWMHGLSFQINKNTIFDIILDMKYRLIKYLFKSFGPLGPF